MKYTADELDFAISQYIDGTLGALEQAALEEVLATDAGARAMLAEYRKLNAALKTELPEVQFDLDELNSRISGALAQAEAPVGHYKLTFASYVKIAAVAASIVVVGLIVKFAGNRGSTGNETPTGIAVITVQGPLAEQAAGPAVAEVSIGAPSGLANAGWQDQAIITRTPRVVIESSALPAQDTGTPY